MAFFKKIKQDISSDQVIENEDKKEEKKVKTKKESPSKETKKEERTDWLKSQGQLAVDVFESDSHFYIVAPIAGVEQNEIDLFLEEDMLVIKGERSLPEQGENKEKKHFYQECYWGPFSRQIIVPENADANKIKASFKKGILIVSMPFRKNEKKQVSINIGN